MGRDKRIWYLSPMRAAKVQASIRAVSPEPSLLAHTSSESRGTFRQKARSLASLNGWACAVKVCHDGMLEDTNSLDGAQIIVALEYVSIVSSSRAKRISGYRLITTQVSEAGHHNMHIGMEYDKSKKSHLLSAGSHNTPLPYLTLVTNRYFG